MTKMFNRFIAFLERLNHDSRDFNSPREGVRDSSFTKAALTSRVLMHLLYRCNIHLLCQLLLLHEVT